MLDVKCGSGAFMKTQEEAQRLADTMTAIGEKLGRRVVAHISDMDNPLGKMIGNKLEVLEAYALLSGRMEETHEDLLDECVVIASLMYQVAAGVDEAEATAAVKRVLADGSAAAKFEEFIVAQGGDVSDIVQNETAHKVSVAAVTEGTVETINALLVGEASVSLGAGRLTKESTLDYDAGIQLVAKKRRSCKKMGILLLIYMPITKSIKIQFLKYSKLIQLYKISFARALTDEGSRFFCCSTIKPMKCLHFV
ncbi:hypothetical protein OL548_13550 [Lysinibacillus sp. MHQ-1]|nr:hypothetical protein OL548_13550 [Lysinibacillus sp. MHQ-1]